LDSSPDLNLFLLDLDFGFKDLGLRIVDLDLLLLDLLQVWFLSIILHVEQFNFVGRILGPRGLTAKQLENDTGCKIMVRGKGSMRDKQKVCSVAAYK